MGEECSPLRGASAPPHTHAYPVKGGGHLPSSSPLVKPSLHSRRPGAAGPPTRGVAHEKRAQAGQPESPPPPKTAAAAAERQCRSSARDAPRWTPLPPSLPSPTPHPNVTPHPRRPLPHPPPGRKRPGSHALSMPPPQSPSPRETPSSAPPPHHPPPNPFSVLPARTRPSRPCTLPASTACARGASPGQSC